jgi:hypothetical protein
MNHSQRTLSVVNFLLASCNYVVLALVLTGIKSIKFTLLGMEEMPVIKFLLFLLQSDVCTFLFGFIAITHVTAGCVYTWKNFNKPETTSLLVFTILLPSLVYFSAVIVVFLQLFMFAQL